MAPARHGFRIFLESELKKLPFRCGSGVVQEEPQDVDFGFPGGRHPSTLCWVYERSDVRLDLVFGFYENFTDSDLITKVVPRGESPTPGSGASVQFNGDSSVLETAPDEWALMHHGKVTVGSSIPRADLVGHIEENARRAVDLLGPTALQAWPLVIGDTSDTKRLLDQLFVYVYAVEQGKRSIRGEEALPTLP